jgi:hypothetical protein
MMMMLVKPHQLPITQPLLLLLLLLLHLQQLLCHQLPL